ncbi:uncharacterized protein [Antedon mediterranea]|uniref:uncharacterized protein n=1 Tax=Antedon mediterranea TaxID=105859 RepID=UPI003AF9426B
MFLTNSRLIMLSNESTEKTEVAAVPPDSTKKPTKYSVKCEAGDVFHYEFLPLKSIRAVELDGMIGASMTTFIDSEESMLKFFRPFSRCCSCCSCCMCCCCARKTEHEVFQRSWFEVGRASHPSANHRIMKLCVDMPPWGNPCIVTIYMRTNTNINIVKEFLRDLQAYGPQMKLSEYQQKS